MLVFFIMLASNSKASRSLKDISRLPWPRSLSRVSLTVSSPVVNTDLNRLLVIKEEPYHTPSMAGIPCLGSRGALFPFQPQARAKSAGSSKFQDGMGTLAKGRRVPVDHVPSKRMLSCRYEGPGSIIDPSWNANLPDPYPRRRPWVFTASNRHFPSTILAQFPPDAWTRRREQAEWR